MVMALERGIALTVFAVGLAVVLLSLVGCGGDGGEPPAGTFPSGCAEGERQAAFVID